MSQAISTFLTNCVELHLVATISYSTAISIVCFALPGRQVETGLEAAKDVDGGGRPKLLDALLDSADHAQPHIVLLRRGHDPLVEVVDLLVKSKNKVQYQFEKSIYRKYDEGVYSISKV